MYVLPQQPSSIAKILDASFRLFTAGFGKIVGIGLMLAAFNVGFAYVVDQYFAMSIPAPAGDAPSAHPEALTHNLPAFFATLIGFTAFTFIFYGAIISRLDNLVHQREDSLGAALGIGVRKLPVLILAGILYGLALAIGSLLLLVPGIILGLSLSLYPIYIIVENLGGYASLKASHNLIWGLWWRTLSIYMAPGILILIFYFLLGMIGYGLADDDASKLGSFGIVDVVTNTLSGLAIPYFYALAYVVFHDLKLRKSGDDLARRLAG